MTLLSSFLGARSLCRTNTDSKVIRLCARGKRIKMEMRAALRQPSGVQPLARVGALPRAELHAILLWDGGFRLPLRSTTIDKHDWSRATLAAFENSDAN
jgi:hypothetical protein